MVSREGIAVNLCNRVCSRESKKGGIGLVVGLSENCIEVVVGETTSRIVASLSFVVSNFFTSYVNDNSLRFPLFFECVVC